MAHAKRKAKKKPYLPDGALKKSIEVATRKICKQIPTARVRAAIARNANLSRSTVSRLFKDPSARLELRTFRNALRARGLDIRIVRMQKRKKSTRTAGAA